AISGARLTLWNVAACERKSSLRLLDLASVLDADEDLVAVGDRSGNVYVWDASRARLVGRGRELASAVEQLRLHAGTRSVLVAARSGAGSEAKLLRLK
ncbi:MAG TPA: hypothetical protein VJR89_17185, partial [Polyangiales bacterium]|nr:hypothetical protein [Polyangiales bacterium]